MSGLFPLDHPQNLGIQLIAVKNKGHGSVVHFEGQEFALEVARHRFKHFSEFPSLGVIRAVHLLREKVYFEHSHNRRSLSTVFLKEGEEPFLDIMPVG